MTAALLPWLACVWPGQARPGRALLFYAVPWPCRALAVPWPCRALAVPWPCLTKARLGCPGLSCPVLCYSFVAGWWTGQRRHPGPRRQHDWEPRLTKRLCVTLLLAVNFPPGDESTLYLYSAADDLDPVCSRPAAHATSSAVARALLRTPCGRWRNMRRTWRPDWLVGWLAGWLVGWWLIC